MGSSAKSRQKTTATTTDSRGMGLLLVFFPQEEDDRDRTPGPNASPTNKLLSRSPGSASSSSPSSATKSSLALTGSASFRRSSSSRILTKAQSTISICALLVFITLLVFTLSTFEPNTAAAKTHHVPLTSRRFLSQTNATNYSHTHSSIFPDSLKLSKFWSSGPGPGHGSSRPKHQFALQGMGTLYRRGTRAMNDLIVAHVVETTTEDEIRLFTRALHRSGSTARADVVLIFHSAASNLGSIIQEENDSFSRLLQFYTQLNGTSASNSKSPSSLSRFDATLFVKSAKSKEKEVAEPIWGKKSRSNDSDGNVDPKQLSYGSVVSFEAAELDPENSLAGFLDHVPMSLRRWACYQMLLGRLRRNFKHVMLVDVKNSVVLSDPLGRVRNRSPESVYLLNRPDGGSSNKHGKKNSDKTQSSNSVSSGIIMGGARGVRRLASSMLTEIVRGAMQQHKRKNSVTESGVLSQLVANEFLLKNVVLIRATEPTPDPASLAANSSSPAPEYAAVHRGNSHHDLSALIMKQICWRESNSSVYKDC